MYVWVNPGGGVGAATIWPSYAPARHPPCVATHTTHWIPKGSRVTFTQKWILFVFLHRRKLRRRRFNRRPWVNPSETRRAAETAATHTRDTVGGGDRSLTVL